MTLILTLAVALAVALSPSPDPNPDPGPSVNPYPDPNPDPDPSFHPQPYHHIPTNPQPAGTPVGGRWRLCLACGRDRSLAFALVTTLSKRAFCAT